MLSSQQCSSGPNMALGIGANNVREYHFRCFCGDQIIATVPKIVCDHCGEWLWIRPEVELTDFQKIALRVVFSGWLWWCIYALGHLIRRV